jgi:hypothetical protein
VLGTVVFSHWLLDLVVHRADMPILPGGHGTMQRLGLGLWRFPNAAMSAELALVIAGAWLYWRATRQTVASVPSPRRRANLAGENRERRTPQPQSHCNTINPNL